MSRGGPTKRQGRGHGPRRRRRAAGSARTPSSTGLIGPAPDGRAPGRATSTRRAGSTRKRRARPTASPSSRVAAADDGARRRRRARRRPDPLAGVIFGTGVGGLETLQEQIGVLAREGPAAGLAASRADDDGERRRGGDLDAPRLAGPVRDDRHGLRVGHPRRSATRYRLIAYGRCDAVIAGGAEAAMTPVGDRRDRHRRLRQHDRTVDERAVAALRRAARRLRHRRRRRPRSCSRSWSTRGPGAPTSTPSCSALPRPRTPTTSPRPLRAAPARSAAWSSRSRTPGSRRPTSPTSTRHGTSTPLNDLAEAEAIEKLFGRPGPPVTSIKGVTGHSLGAAGRARGASPSRSVDRATADPADGGPRAAGPRDPPRHRTGRAPAVRPRGPCSRTASVSAGTTDASCSRPVAAAERCGRGPRPDLDGRGRSATTRRGSSTPTTCPGGPASTLVREQDPRRGAAPRPAAAVPAVRGAS